MPDAVDQPEGAVLARVVLEVESDIATTPPPHDDFGLEQRDRVATADRDQGPQLLVFGRHGSLLGGKRRRWLSPEETARLGTCPRAVGSGVIITELDSYPQASSGSMTCDSFR